MIPCFLHFTNIFVLFIILYEISFAYVNCIIEASSVTTDHEAVTFASCSNPDHTLVSCGHRTVNPQETYFRGSWITEQTCWAQNGSPSEGVYAIARCCDLSSYSFSCHTIQSALSSSGEDATTDATCSATEALLGCTVSNMVNDNDGCYPLNDTSWPWESIPTSTFAMSNPISCIGKNNWGGGGAFSYATCCTTTNNTIIFECEAVWSLDLADVDVTMSCPNTDQFMTSCSAVNSMGMINTWEINSNGECHISKNTPATTWFYRVVVICCSISILSTINDPTLNPTFNPALLPTLNPTSDPMSTTLNIRLATVDTATTDLATAASTEGERDQNVLIVVLLISIVFCIVIAIYVMKKENVSVSDHIDDKNALVTNRNIVDVHAHESVSVKNNKETGGKYAAQQLSHGTELEGATNNDIYSGYKTPIGLKKRANKDALDIQYWLENVVQLPQYFECFMDSGYEGMDFIKEIQNVEELHEVGIESIQHQNKLFEAIRKLKGEEAVQMSCDMNRTVEGDENNAVETKYI